MPKYTPMPPVIDARVPDELLVQVLCGLLDEDEAIARGRRAAAAASLAGRHAILFPETPIATELRRPPYRPTGSPPWQEP